MTRRALRAAGDLRGAVSLFHGARSLAVEQVASVLIEGAVCATDAGRYREARNTLDELARLTRPTPPAWAAAQARLARAAVIDAQEGPP